MGLTTAEFLEAHEYLQVLVYLIALIPAKIKLLKIQPGKGASSIGLQSIKIAAATHPIFALNRCRGTSDAPLGRTNLQDTFQILV